MPVTGRTAAPLINAFLRVEEGDPAGSGGGSRGRHGGGGGGGVTAVAKGEGRGGGELRLILSGGKAENREGKRD